VILNGGLLSPKYFVYIVLLTTKAFFDLIRTGPGQETSVARSPYHDRPASQKTRPCDAACVA
jgi:hypothetical protein